MYIRKRTGFDRSVEFERLTDGFGITVRENRLLSCWC